MHEISLPIHYFNIFVLFSKLAIKVNFHLNTVLKVKRNVVLEILKVRKMHLIQQAVICDDKPVG